MAHFNNNVSFTGHAYFHVRSNTAGAEHTYVKHRYLIIHTSHILSTLMAIHCNVNLYSHKSCHPGNGICISQAGAVLVALLAFVIPDNSGLHMLVPPSPSSPGQLRGSSWKLTLPFGTF